ncbi:MAG: hypothetical protein M0P17_06945 [Methanoculleus sp.]|nr:hypothetical protein [Methanoculleus sp.]
MQNRSLIFPFILYTLVSGVMPVRCSGSRSADLGRADVALSPGVAAAPAPGAPGGNAGAIVSGPAEVRFVKSTVARIDPVAAGGAMTMADGTAIAVGKVAV